MADHRRRLLERIASLTPDQRQALAERLVGASGSRSLTAYVMTSGSVTAGELRSFLAERLPEHMVPAQVIVVDALPRTGSGKIDRHALARLAPVETGGTRLPASVAPRTPIEEQLAGIWCEVLGLDRVGVHDDFFAIGGDSLLSIRLLSRAGRHGLRVEPETFFANPTIAWMAAALGPQDVGSSHTPPEGGSVGRAPLTPIQHWFFERVHTDRHHWNQSYLLAIPAETTATTIAAVVGMLISHHDGLRTRFGADERSPQQVIDPHSGHIPCRFVDVSALEAAARSVRISAECRAAQQAASLEDGSLARFVLFDCGTGTPKRLLIVAHHLLIDAYSWGILLEDLATLLGQAIAGQALSLPPKTAGMLEWSRALAHQAQRPEMLEEVRPWLVMPDVPAFPAAPRAAHSEDRVGDAASVRIALERAETAALSDGSDGRTTLERLLAALVLAWRDQTGVNVLRVDVEGHGRNVLPGGPDVSRTVGWFTTVFPMVLTAAEGPADTLRQVSATYRALGRKGASYGLARYLGPPPLHEQLARTPPARMLLNYLGRIDVALPPGGILAWASEDRGPDRGPLGERAYVIEINSHVTGGCLHFDLSYNPGYHTRDVAESLARHFRARLRDVSVRAVASNAPFELSGLDASGMSQVAALLDEADEG